MSALGAKNMRYTTLKWQASRDWREKRTCVRAWRAAASAVSPLSLNHLQLRSHIVRGSRRNTADLDGFSQLSAGAQPTKPRPKHRWQSAISWDGRCDDHRSACRQGRLASALAAARATGKCCLPGGSGVDHRAMALALAGSYCPLGMLLPHYHASKMLPSLWQQASSHL